MTVCTATGTSLVTSTVTVFSTVTWTSLVTSIVCGVGVGPQAARTKAAMRITLINCHSFGRNTATSLNLSLNLSWLIWVTRKTRQRLVEQVILRVQSELLAPPFTVVVELRIMS